ncbi:MAG: GDSL-type esterase/lipase family protein [Firmicutes bacterium]|nr:GDSL-type esterase/lipase family protein [Bacillota bacterium]
MNTKQEKILKIIYLVFILVLTLYTIGILTGVLNDFWLKPATGSNIPYGTRPTYTNVYNFPNNEASDSGLLTLLSLINIYLLLDFFLLSKITGWKKTATTIASVIIILFVTEVVYWNAIRKNPSMFTPHPIWLWQVTPNLNNFKYIQETTVSSNKYGFRNPDFPQKKPQGQFRVMLLGDSSAHGFMVNEEETFAYILEKRLKELNPGKDILIINAANPGTTTTLGRAFFEDTGYKFEPDIILISYNNDHGRERETDNSRIPRGIIRPIKKALYKSAIYLGLRKELVNMQVRRNPALAVMQPGEKFINRVPVSEYKDNIRYFKEYADKTGAKVILLEMPKSAYISDYYKALSEAAAENKCMYIDFMKDFEQLPTSEYIFEDGIHPTAKGHKRIADSLVELFNREKLIK